MTKIWYATGIFLLLAGCNGLDRKVQTILQLLDTNKKIEVSHIDGAREMIVGEASFSTAQVAELRDAFSAYLAAFAESETGRLAAEMDMIFNQTDDILIQRRTDSLFSACEKLKIYGITVSMVEGNVQVSISPMYIANTFWNYLSEGERQWAFRMETEMNDPVLEDASIVIAYEELANRLFICDELLKNYAEDSLLTPQVELFRNHYLVLLMFGCDNTPAFDWRTKQLQHEVREALISYINRHPDALSSPTIREYIELLQKNRFKKTAEIQEFGKRVFNK
ncbi:MAG: hypothetical protein LBS01_07385 [Prevotellaceae bacterium]|jgi:hypothetical protein|nr:hypothetical protein [Prevotellaceae bacterium]